MAIDPLVDEIYDDLRARLASRCASRDGDGAKLGRRTKQFLERVHANWLDEVVVEPRIERLLAI